ncbi:hypothetical protein AVEN_214440-1 [Araneus ventricosus]|uniref:Uncharacterized protein n=1 Tax=Araneus ventricosus TaxID=182803 RepID=A0A4Y2N175_ARAVE|nr:hypothetical protein AVEN_214440-1 [Araneus ventricosus]
MMKVNLISIKKQDFRNNDKNGCLHGTRDIKEEVRFISRFEIALELFCDDAESWSDDENDIAIYTTLSKFPLYTNVKKLDPRKHVQSAIGPHIWRIWVESDLRGNDKILLSSNCIQNGYLNGSVLSFV